MARVTEASIKVLTQEEPSLFGSQRHIVGYAVRGQDSVIHFKLTTSSTHLIRH